MDMAHGEGGEHLSVDEVMSVGRGGHMDAEDVAATSEVK